MTAVTATELAQRLKLSKGRISQLVAKGTLDGCYSGEGRNRRFDLAKSLTALGQRLDPGQMMGNGAGTRQALQEQPISPSGDLPLEMSPPPAGAMQIPEGDQDAYSLARTAKAIEEARKLKRQNAEAEGEFVLANEVNLKVKRQMSQEIAAFEQVLRTGARAIADEFNIDFKTAKSILISMWREHRAKRARVLANAAAEAGLTEAEEEQDI